ncbi:HK97-gp10 family putative phage morphogenesis protein [Pelistega ratti]|uniref:HK97-gp10 family putative phage morphogenesis protein n=1 Tax=Pelistega ratti TaxID=2652177 RepID=UPI00135B1434|nr:HK97-gp10 family putative phage morphogenesis protein [Pelistega ratti]
MKVRVEGLRELSDRLEKLDKKVAGQVVRKAAIEGSKLIRNEAKNRVPVYLGILKQNIVVKRFRDRGKGNVRYGIGLVSSRAVYKNNKVNRKKGRVGKTYYQGKTVYGHMVEFGTRKMKARPFLRPAFESQKEKAVDVVKNTLKQEIDKL